MYINSKSGELSINQTISFHLNLRASEFEQRSDIVLWKKLIENEVFRVSVFSQDVVDYNGRKVNVYVGFLNSCLTTVSLSFFLPTEKTERFRERNYPNADMRRYYLHKSILSELLGDLPHRFKWGFISLGCGADGFSAILVNYICNSST